MAHRSDNPPRTPVTRDRVLAEALRLADAEGLERLTMRRLGQACGVEAMSLYHHVADKEAVLDGLTEAVLAEVELPLPGAAPWDETVCAGARALRDAYLQHPGALSALAVRPAFRHAHGRRLIEWMLTVLRDAGFTALDAMYGSRTIGMFVTGFAGAAGGQAGGHGGVSAGDHGGVSAGGHGGVTATEAVATLDQISESEFPVQVALRREASQQAGGASAWDWDDLFEFGLRALVDGLTLRLGQSKTSG